MLEGRREKKTKKTGGDAGSCFIFFVPLQKKSILFLFPLIILFIYFVFFYKCPKIPFFVVVVIRTSKKYV